MIPGSANPLLMAAAQDTGYNVSRSLRFNSADSAYLSRTPGSAGNRRTWTLSLWAKRSTLGAAYKMLFSAGSAANECSLRFTDSPADALEFYQYSGGGFNWRLVTTQVFRDPSAWYHIVAVVDSTQATSAERAKLYVNGAQVTTFGTASYPTQNYDSLVNSTVEHGIGRVSAAQYFDGLLAECHLIDGSALTPSSFAETNATTGQWVPKAFSGSYGTNGFKLTFSDNSGTTSTTLGKDSAGSNNWTPNNFSVTAGAGNDSLVDTPTSYGTDDGLGGSVRGNYCTYNRLNSAGTLANGNLESTPGADLNNGYAAVSSIAIPVSGKWYAEFTLSSLTSGAAFLGVIPASANGTLSNRFSIAGSYGYISINGNKRIADVDSSYGATYAAGDVIGVAVNMDNLELTFYKNNSSQGAISIASNSYIFCSSGGANSSGVTWIANFGQRPFAYTAPSGFKALCDTNLPTPTIVRPSTVFDTKLYTGNGSTQNITGLGFSPDLVWIKSRSTGTLWHEVFDVIRGANNRLFTNATNAETTNNTLSSFNSDGFTLSITDSNGYGVNLNNDSYVAWAWDAGSSTVTNTQGSITSTVRANASPGFSVITYTGNGVSNATVGHGLGVAPRLIFVKARSAAQPWIVLTTAIDGSQDYALLNTTDAFANDVVSATPTSTVFSISNGAAVNGNGTTYVAYAWAPVANFSAFGSYVGNGSSDGPFIYTGFRPRYFFIKRSDSTGDWRVYDTARSPYNTAGNDILFNSSQADADLWPFDILSNGFKVRSSDVRVNASGGTFVWAAFAESPFQYARAR